MDTPKLNVDTDEVMSSFIDQYMYVKCGIPDDEELVSKVQKHRHLITCRRLSTAYITTL